MEPAEYAMLYRVEMQHWWYAGMQRISHALLEPICRPDQNLRILDAGCGTGGNMLALSTYGQIAGCDYSPLALSYSRRRNLTLLAQATVEQLPYPDAHFDLVTSFDVIYHRAVREYGQALQEFQRVLRPGGWLLLRVPALEQMRRHHDEVVHTARRFSREQLRRDLMARQFRIQKLSYANTILFPVALTKRWLETYTTPTASESDIHPNPPWLDRLLTALMSAEAAWLKHFNFPVGLSLFALAQRM